MSQARICAIIPTFDRKELLTECIQAILNQTRRPDTILVIDNASHDGTAPAVRRCFPEVELLINCQNLGSAGGFAQGIKWAYQRGFDWLWIIDNDAVAASNCLESLLEASQKLKNQNLEPSALGSTAYWTDGRIHPMNMTLPDWYRLGLQSKLQPHGISPKLWVTWVSVLLPRWAVALNGLPHGDFFTWNEDMEYLTRFSRCGVCAMVEQSKVVHKTATPYTPASSTGSRFYYEIRNKIWVLRSSTFNLLEKIWILGCTLGNAFNYLRHNPKDGWGVVQRGLRDGIKDRPDPKLVKLS